MSFTYRYYKNIPVAARSSGSISDCPMHLFVYSGSGTDSPGVVYLSNHSNYFPNDIRFYDSNDNFLWYFIEDASTNPISVWLKVPTISQTSTTTYKICYGSNSSVPTSSNAANVFSDFMMWDSDHTSEFTVTSYTTNEPNTKAQTKPLSKSYSSARILFKVAVSGTKPTSFSPWVGFGVSNQPYAERVSGFDDAFGIFFNCDTDNNADADHSYIKLRVFSGAAATVSTGLVRTNNPKTYRIFELRFLDSSFVSGLIYSANRINVIYSESITGGYVPEHVDYLWYDINWGSTQYKYRFNYESSEEALDYFGWRQSSDLSYLGFFVKWSAIDKYPVPEPQWESPGQEVDTTVVQETPSGNLIIYYSSLAAPHYINCWCNRWDVSDYTVTIETLMKKNDLKTLMDNTRPGAVRELYQVLGRKVYYDSTFERKNTLKISPASSSRLYNLRKEQIIYVKNLSSTPLPGRRDFLSVKIDGYVSGTIL